MQLGQVSGLMQFGPLSFLVNTNINPCTLSWQICNLVGSLSVFCSCFGFFKNGLTYAVNVSHGLFMMINKKI
jgi:hypothetical protein